MGSFYKRSNYLVFGSCNAAGLISRCEEGLGPSCWLSKLEERIMGGDGSQWIVWTAFAGRNEAVLQEQASPACRVPCILPPSSAEDATGKGELEDVWCFPRYYKARRGHCIHSSALFLVWWMKIMCPLWYLQCLDVLMVAVVLDVGYYW